MKKEDSKYKKKKRETKKKEGKRKGIRTIGAVNRIAKYFKRERRSGKTIEKVTVGL